MVCYTESVKIVVPKAPRKEIFRGLHDNNVGRANSVQPEKDIQKEAKRRCNLLALGTQCRDCDWILLGLLNVQRLEINMP
ncbi:hypothetical protein T12_10186 [Trichinella patagoniensis]|uniref:Uncharacterized protein n=1 Tax=Trichinella patagoniensis TaxID=990121 RepID=A0A0V0Z4H3_9BILA|nr:hypothetical protein T12_10186 [Trichinella patagoniensis]